MKVLLIVPTHSYMTGEFKFLSVSDFPTGFAYLASSLKEAGHKVFGLNLNNMRGYASPHDVLKDKIPSAIKEIKPDLIGTGGLCIDYKFIKDAMQIIREISNIPIVLGGGIISHDAEFIFNTLKPDFCIIGEAEESIVQLANVLESGKKNFETIDNLGYWREE